MIDAILTNTVLPRISQEILLRLMDGRTLSKVALDVTDSDFSYVFE